MKSPVKPQKKMVGKPAKSTSDRWVEVLYEDRDIIVVDKPAGLPTIAPDSSKTKSLLDIVNQIIQKKNPRSRAALVHRLDRDTSGVIAFAKNPKAKMLLMGQWRDRADERRYTALVEGIMPDKNGILDSWLDASNPYRVKTVAFGSRNSQRAISHYHLIKIIGKYSLLELELKTGRRHQLRVQLAAIGHPIVGDERYGAKTDPSGRLCLHASRLVLRSVSDNSLITAESLAPDFLGDIVH
ncbi:RluA family pseudouridine synthase [Spirochaetota bacterium]